MLVQRYIKNTKKFKEEATQKTSLLLLLLLSRVSRVWLCANPIDGSPPGSPVPDILQARTLEWVASAFSRRPQRELIFELSLEEQKLLLQERANSDSMLELFLVVRAVWLALHCFCYYNHAWWPASKNPAPLPDCYTKESLFRTLSTCGCQEGRIITSPVLRATILKDICKINGLLTLFPHCPPSLFCKRNWHPDCNKMVILRHYLPSSWQ